MFSSNAIEGISAPLLKTCIPTMEPPEQRLHLSVPARLKKRREWLLVNARSSRGRCIDERHGVGDACVQLIKTM